MVAPNSDPFQHEPGCKGPVSLGSQLLLERLGTHPAPIVDFRAVYDRRLGRATDKYRTKLVLGSGCIELRLILEFEQVLQGTIDPQLLPQPPFRRKFQSFVAPRVTAAAIRPIQRPEPFAGSPLLN